MDTRDRWELMPWVWVILFSLFIFLTIPFARKIQIFLYNNLGKEFLTHITLFLILIILLTLLYLFIFILNIRRPSQYIWLIISASLYGYFTIKLKRHPEEAFHLLEYSLLSYLFFRALSKKLRDPSVYITSILFVSLIGIIDEIIQWMMPERFWGFKDVGLNTFSGVIFMLGLQKGVRPQYINKPPTRLSINILLTIITITLLLLGLCLSNTPTVVSYYAKGILSWLKDEEPMVEYGYRYKDPDIGVIYSRLTQSELRDIDTRYGKSYGREVSDALNKGVSFKDLIKAYKPPENTFLYEFIIHLFRREDAMSALKESNDSNKRHINTVLKENLILERFFTNTLKHSAYTMSDDTLNGLRMRVLMNDEEYVSGAGGLITTFNLQTAWATLLITIIALWTGGIIWRRMTLLR